jgi:hypothetical protein
MGTTRNPLTLADFGVTLRMSDKREHDVTESVKLVMIRQTLIVG